MRLPGILIIGLAMLLGVSCGTSQESGLNSFDEELQRPVLILSGGNSSCAQNEDKEYTPVGMSMYGQFLQLLEDAGERSIDLDYILTCYRNYAETFDVHYVFSDSPETVHRTTRADFYVEAGRYLEAAAPGPVIMAGHSYGGWLAMRAAIDLNREFDSLYTLDAISQTECQFARPFGCTSAPRDIKSEERQVIADNTNNWVNFYQTQTWYLHSGSMTQADQNIRLNTGHNGVDTDNQVWDSIHSRTMQLAGIEPVKEFM